MGSTVKDVAERVGIPARTVRYYSRVGLVRPSERTSAGYGLYQPSDEGKLRFVAQAKALGLSLAEIRRLLEAAERGCCGEVNPELDSMLAAKIAAVEERIGELSAFRDQLRAYRDGRSGRCGCRGHDPFCGCLGDVADHMRQRRPPPGPANVQPNAERRHGMTTHDEVSEQLQPSPKAGCDCGCKCCAASDDERSSCGCRDG